MKIALVTGAGSGIGRACSIALAEAGFTLVLAGRDEAKLKATQALIKTPSHPVPTDVTDPKQVSMLFAAIKNNYGRLDLLFNNAGTGAPGTVLLEDLTFEQWTNVVNTNITGPFLCTQQAFKIMKDQTPRGGRIINNGSISATAPRPNSAPYTATKHAITGLTKASNLDGRKYDIAVGQIDIGNAQSDMTKSMATGMPQADGNIRPEPTMDVNEVARAVVHMASLPLSANILFMTVMATKMPFVGRG